MKIKEAWESFEKAVLEPDVHPIQKQEMRRAFYAGVSGLLHMLASSPDEVMSDGPEGEDAARVVFESLAAELSQFQADMEAGKA